MTSRDNLPTKAGAERMEPDIAAEESSRLVRLFARVGVIEFDAIEPARNRSQRKPRRSSRNFISNSIGVSVSIVVADGSIKAQLGAASNTAHSPQSLSLSRPAQRGSARLNSARLSSTRLRLAGHCAASGQRQMFIACEAINSATSANKMPPQPDGCAQVVRLVVLSSIGPANTCCCCCSAKQRNRFIFLAAACAGQ